MKAFTSSSLCKLGVSTTDLGESKKDFDLCDECLGAAGKLECGGSLLSSSLSSPMLRLSAVGRFLLYLGISGVVFGSVSKCFFLYLGISGGVSGSLS